jgi:Kef-type K+ transport system membrane component KefB
MPWMFAALFLGIIFSMFNFFTQTIKSDSFQFLSNLGMFGLLFLIGFNLNLKKIKSLKNYIILGGFSIISLEALFVGSLLYFVFPDYVDNSLFIALLAALSFATVGEAILLPILAEFKAVNTVFGQLTLGIGTFDDIIEVLSLIIIASLPVFLTVPKISTEHFPNPYLVIFSLATLLISTFLIIKIDKKIKKKIEKYGKKNYFVFPILLLFLFFLFISLPSFVFESLAAIGALLCGMIVRQMLPEKVIKETEKNVNFLIYIFLSPIFFFAIGSDVSLTSLILSPLLIILLWSFTASSKILTSFLFFHKLLGNRYSLLAGLGLSVRFSTSLIAQYILLNSGFISLTLYSAFIATAILMKPLILLIYSWQLAKRRPP